MINQFKQCEPNFSIPDWSYILRIFITSSNVVDLKFRVLCNVQLLSSSCETDFYIYLALNKQNKPDPIKQCVITEWARTESANLLVPLNTQSNPDRMARDERLPSKRRSKKPDSASSNGGSQFWRAWHGWQTRWRFECFSRFNPKPINC